MISYEFYIKECLKLAQKAKEAGKTAVGSLIVQNNTVIAEGIEGNKDLPAIMAHAEALAILQAIEKLGKRDLSDCALYTTVEPCFLCSYLIRQVKIKKVVFGAETPAGGASSAYPILKATEIPVWSRPPEIVGGVLEKICGRMLEK